MSIEDKIHKIKKARISEEEILVQHIIDKSLFDDNKSTNNRTYWVFDKKVSFRIDKDGRYKNSICLTSNVRKFLQEEKNMDKDEIKNLVAFCFNKSKIITTPIKSENIFFFNFD